MVKMRNGGGLIASGSEIFAVKDRLKKNGWFWNWKSKVWEKTSEPDLMDSFLVPLMDFSAKSYFYSRNKQAMQIPGEYSPPGVEIFPFQKTGADFIIKNSGCVLADEQGTGKTIQAIAAINKLKARSVLIVSPIVVKQNWKRELDKWLIDKGLNVLIPKDLFEIASDTIYVLHYEMMVKILHLLKTHHFDIAIFDEGHYLKNADTQRSISCANVNATRKVSLTGTPIFDTPGDLFGLFRSIDVVSYGQKSAFLNGNFYIRSTRYGKKITGFRNISSFKNTYKNVLLRRTKKEVCSELPEKFYEFTRLPLGISSGTYHDSLKKTEYICGKVQLRLDVGKKTVIFVHHHEIGLHLLEHLPGKKAYVSGLDDPNEKDEKVQAFVHGSIDTIICGIRSCGVGINLQVSDYAIFAEFDYTPGAMSQAGDRIHRIGSKSNVTIELVVLSGSMDDRVISILQSKSIDFHRIHEVGRQIQKGNENDSGDEEST